MSSNKLKLKFSQLIKKSYFQSNLTVHLIHTQAYSILKKKNQQNLFQLGKTESTKIKWIIVDEEFNKHDDV